MHALQDTYEDAYEASLQCIILETSNQKDAAFMSWKATLNMINESISKLPGTPRSGSEQSLMTSIRDIQRQCQERLAYLEAKDSPKTGMHQKRASISRTKPPPPPPPPPAPPPAPPTAPMTTHPVAYSHKLQPERPQHASSTGSSSLSDHSPVSNIYFTPPNDSSMTRTQPDNYAYSTHLDPSSSIYNPQHTSLLTDDPFGIYNPQSQAPQSQYANNDSQVFGNFVSNVGIGSGVGSGVGANNPFANASIGAYHEDDELNDSMYRLHPFDSAPPQPPPHTSGDSSFLPRPPSHSPPPVPRKVPLIQGLTPSLETSTQDYFPITHELATPSSKEELSTGPSKPPVPIPLARTQSDVVNPGSSTSSLDRSSSSSPEKVQRSSLDIHPTVTSSSSGSSPFSFFHRSKSSKSKSATDLNNVFAASASPTSSSGIPPPVPANTPPSKQTILRTLRDGKAGKLANGARGTANQAASKAWPVPERPQSDPNYTNRVKLGAAATAIRQNQHSSTPTTQSTVRQTTPPLIDVNPTTTTTTTTSAAVRTPSPTATLTSSAQTQPVRKVKPIIVYRHPPAKPGSPNPVRVSTVKVAAAARAHAAAGRSPVGLTRRPGVAATAASTTATSTGKTRPKLNTTGTTQAPTQGTKSRLPTKAAATSPVVVKTPVPVKIPLLASGGKPEEKVEIEEQDNEEELTETQIWERKTRETIKNIRGIDESAADQIMNDIILKGDEVRWDDIAGLEKAKNSLKETVVYPFLRPDLFSGLREPARGMLLFGPPGTGKTMLARAVATESKSTFFSISASSLVSKFLGESEKLVKALFLMAQALAPSIIFVDEIDSLLSTRSENGEHETSRRIKTEFLVQWSALQHAAAGKEREDSQRVLVLAATNLPWAIDEAARRRFVRRQYIPLPENATRKAHLKKLLSYQVHTINDDQFDELVELTQGFSGSDLTALAKDAAMGPLRALGEALLTTPREQIRPLGFEDFLSSLQTIRPSVSKEGLQEFEKWADMYGSSGA